jgi:hypothetical protein
MSATERHWRLVPVEPTPEMLDAFIDKATKEDGFSHGLRVDDPRKGYAAMLAKAPQPEPRADRDPLFEESVRLLKAAIQFAQSMRASGVNNTDKLIEPIEILLAKLESSDGTR